MKVRLGYVAIPITLQDKSYFHTLTYTQYEHLSCLKRKEKLDQILRYNLDTFYHTLQYNKQNDIFFYRFSHNIVPLATHPKVSFDCIKEYAPIWGKIGDYIRHNGMRVDSHPDQYCVLNSTNEDVVKSSIQILKTIDQMYQAMNIQSFMILHVGSSYPTKEEAKSRFLQNFKALPKRIQKEIILENDDRVFHALDVLEICEELGIPMILDVHHEFCHSSPIPLKDLLPRIFSTWKSVEMNPKIHFSSRKSRQEKRSHHTYINYKSFCKCLELLKTVGQDVDIMLECKGKDEALFRLVRQLRFHKNGEFCNQTTFYIS